MLVDQTFAITEPRPDDDPIDYRMAHFLAGGLYWLVLWIVAVAVGLAIGLTVGDVIPDAWSLEFSVPLLFLGLLVNAVRDRPGLLAAVASGLTAVAARDLQPVGSGLLVAALVGVVVGSLADAYDEGSDRSPAGPSGPTPGDEGAV